jgi:putative ABC transport system ATP-binding protein
LTSVPLIRIRDLTRRASSGRLLLDRIGLDVACGQRIGLIGPSGSGKSSLLRSIAMLDRCESGEVSYCGAVIRNDQVPGYRRQVIYVPQRPAFAVGSVRHNLQMPFQWAASQSQYDESCVIVWLQQLERSADLLDQPIDQLSGGEQQMVALVRALSLRPRALLLDEPTASLDATAAKQFEDLVNVWQTEDGERTFVWTSHDWEQVRRMTTRVLSMRSGVLSEGVIDA